MLRSHVLLASVLGLGAWAVSTSDAVFASGGEVQAPAEFTGEVKPVFYVENVQASAPFFRDVLGFEFHGFSESNAEPYYAEMSAGSLKFGLHNPLNERHEAWVGHQRLYLRVMDVEAHRTRVLASGGDAGEVVETDWMDFFIVPDLDGHEIVFAETSEARHSIDPW